MTDVLRMGQSLIFVPFFAPQSKKTITMAMGESGAQRRGEAKRRRRPATCALYLVLFLRSEAEKARACSRAGRSRSEVEARSGAKR